jgi:carbamoyltransferase
MNDTILGLNAFHGDSSAAVFAGGQLLSAAEEERYNRVKHWAGLPAAAAADCLRMAGVERVDHIAVSRDPGAHLFNKLVRISFQPGLWRSAATRAANSICFSRIREDLSTAGVPGLEAAEIHYVEHHRAHLASAFFASPFEEAAVVSIDGFGDFASMMWGVGRGATLDVRGEVQFPHSLGIFYTAFTQYLGFPNYGDEYKMMGLSAYGQPRFRDEVRRIVRVEGDQVRLNLDYFQHHTTGVQMTWAGGAPEVGPVYSGRMVETFGPARIPRTELSQRHCDLAASVQAVLEECYLSLLRHVRAATGCRAVCLAGGVALNCVANGKILEETDFTDVYVQPAAHDAGTAIGAALYVQHHVLKQPRSFVMRHVYYGRGFDDADIRGALETQGAIHHRLDDAQLVRRTARAIADGEIVGWFQGRMEFGPRALGNRSILADPRRAEIRDVLNRRIKYREPFRPFCPSILSERTAEYFETSYASPFMVQAYKIRRGKARQIPAVTHRDGTGRLQTVERDVNPLYWSLIREFENLTGVPVLLNTSFNENEPIVETPQQALDCFLRTQMDTLVMGRYYLEKRENALWEKGEEMRPKAFAAGAGG